MDPAILEEKPTGSFTELLSRPKARRVFMAIAILLTMLSWLPVHLSANLQLLTLILGYQCMFAASPLLPIYEHSFLKSKAETSAENVDSSSSLMALRDCLRRSPCWPAFAILVTSGLVHFLVGQMPQPGVSLNSNLLLSFLAALIPPALAGVLCWAVKTKTPTKLKRVAKPTLLKRVAYKAIDGLQETASKPLPFYSTYVGWLLCAVLVINLPGSVGQMFIGFLDACTRDADIAGSNDPFMHAAIRILLTFAVAAVGHPLAVWLGAIYQSILNNFISRNGGEGLLDAIHETAVATRTKVTLRERHPHVRSAFQSLLLFASVYAALFWCIAFWNSGVNDAIQNWLAASTADANMWQYVHIPPMPMHEPMPKNLLMFLAAVIAAWATVPISLMTCVYLPPHKRKSLQLTKEGILRADQLFKPSLHFWSSLRSVSLKKAGKPGETLVLSFTSGKLKLRTDTICDAELAKLLSMTDEFGTHCRFDAPSQELRARLSQQQSESFLADKKKFESLIFRPHKIADTICDGKYWIVRKLATKPWAATYLARAQSGQLVIIKQFVTPASAGNGAAWRNEFEREYTLLAQLDHPALAKVQSTFKENEADYIVIDYINGQNLRQVVALNGPRREKTVLQWALEVAEQLSYLHSQSPAILHRDLTPDNLMLDEDGHVRIVDFGAAHQFLEGVTGTLIGKQAYIAPEQLRGTPTPGSDIYSLGSTMYFLLTGNDPKALSQSDVSQEVTVSDGLQKLIWRCTDFDERQRPQSMDEVLQALRQLSPSGRKIKLKTKNMEAELVSSAGLQT